MVEVARLESVYTFIAYRGFESLPLRQIVQTPALRAFVFVQARRGAGFSGIGHFLQALVLPVVRHIAPFFSVARTVYADKGYSSADNRQHLQQHWLQDGIMDKAHRGQPLTAEQKKRNTRLSKTRYVVEQSFGTLHRKFRYGRQQPAPV